MPLEEAMAVCRGEEPARPLDHADRDVVDEAQHMVRAKGLVPAVVLRYERQAFGGRDEEGDLRVTFDRRVGFRMRDLVPRPDDRDIDEEILPPERVIMEVKVDERVPYWLAVLVAGAGATMQSHSKYCAALEHSGYGLGRERAAVPSWRVDGARRLVSVWTS
jgi:hypothetical protein